MHLLSTDLKFPFICKASSSSGPSSTLFRHFVGAGFPENLVAKAIEENGKSAPVL